MVEAECPVVRCHRRDRSDIEGMTRLWTGGAALDLNRPQERHSSILTVGTMPTDPPRIVTGPPTH